MPIGCDVQIGGRLSAFPEWYPIDRRYLFATPEEAEHYSFREHFRLDAEAEYFSKRYDIASLVAINQLMPISAEEWLGLREDPFTKAYGLPEPIKKAIAFEVAKIGRDRESKQREQQQELKLEQTEFSGRLNFGTPNTSFGKVYS